MKWGCKMGRGEVDGLGHRDMTRREQGVGLLATFILAFQPRPMVRKYVMFSGAEADGGRMGH